MRRVLVHDSERPRVGQLRIRWPQDWIVERVDRVEDGRVRLVPVDLAAFGLGRSRRGMAVVDLPASERRPRWLQLRTLDRWSTPTGMALECVDEGSA